MFNLQVTSTTMELLPLVCLCLLTRSGTTFAEEGSNVIRVDQGSDATLTCSLSSMEDIELKLFDWKKDGQKEVFLYDGGLHYNNGRTGQDQQFDGRVSHFPDKLKHGDASIKIRNTKVNDSGDYTCAFPRLEPSQIFHTRLVVGRILKDRSGENIPGSKVINVEEDSDVTLPCSLSTKEDIEDKLFDWRKDGQKDVFLYDEGLHSNNGRTGQDEQFKGRVSHFPDELKHGDASIKINKTRVADSGNYTCDFPHLKPRQIFHIQLVVGPKVIRVEEDRDVTLPCSLSSMEDIEFNRFHWRKDGQKDVFLYDAGFHYNNGLEGQDEQFKGRVSHFPDRLKLGDASIIIRNTKVTDSGDYTCAFPRLQPSQIFHIRLVVDPILKDRSGENIPGAAAKPYIEIFEMKDGMLLQCEVQGASPPLKLHWQDRARNNLSAEETRTERGGRFYITLNTTVTKTDRYRCVATQEDIGHQIYAEIFVHISGPILTDGSGRILTDGSGPILKDGESGPTESPTGWIVAVSVLCTLLVGGVVLAVLYKKGYIKLNCKQGSPTQPTLSNTLLTDLNMSREVGC